MNLTHQAKKLETYLKQELYANLPVAVLKNGDLVYKEFKIKKNKKTDNWDVYSSKYGKVESFYLKACALIAANFYSSSSFNKFKEIKLMDSQYQRNFIDAEIFKYRYDTTKDAEKRDVYLWRWEITNARAKIVKQEITNKFRMVFDK